MGEGFPSCCANKNKRNDPNEEASVIRDRESGKREANGVERSSRGVRGNIHTSIRINTQELRGALEC